VDADLDTLVIALYVQVDDILKANPDRVPWRPAVGITPRITDAEVVTLAVAQALLGFTSEARWLRFGRAHLQQLFPYLPAQSGYNKRLRKLGGTLSWLIRALGTQTSLFSDDVWLADSTPVECGRSRETAHPLGPGRLRRVRILRLAQPLLLGTATAPDQHTPRTTDRSSGHRSQSRRAAGPARPARRRGPDPPDRRHHLDRGQELLRPRLRNHPSRDRSPAPAAYPQR